jgi:hypothetical protein
VPAYFIRVESCLSRSDEEVFRQINVLRYTTAPFVAQREAEKSASIAVSSCGFVEFDSFSMVCRELGASVLFQEAQHARGRSQALRGSKTEIANGNLDAHVGIVRPVVFRRNVSAAVVVQLPEHILTKPAACFCALMRQS